MAPVWRGAALLPLLLLAILSSIYAGPVPVRKASPVEVSSNSSSLTVCKYENDTYVEGNDIQTTNKCESCYCGPEGAMVCVPRCRQMVEPMTSGECYKDNKTYSNGQKINMAVPGTGVGSDPCKVCYCVKGEVVCSPLACYRRDDCEPRFVPGRCCPEYDHCPLKDTDTTEIQKSPDNKEVKDHTKNITSAEGKEGPKKVITIKEVTPVSEIPSLGGIKIKEILPPAIEVQDYVHDSTKAPLTQREVPITQATSEKTTQATIQPETTNHLENTTTTAAPPVIKIGEATVITVIGAEGLERGGEEDESLYSKLDNNKLTKLNNTHLYERDSDDKIGATSNIEMQQFELSGELAEVMKELYATTTITPQKSSNFSLTTMETLSPYITESDNLVKDIQHEHMNEEDDIINRDHNIEFPPIPDDITIHHQDESMDVSETPALEVEKVEVPGIFEMVTVNQKRPVFSLSSNQELRKENEFNDIVNPAKTLLNLHATKHNGTKINDDNSNVMTEDWLKSSIEISTDENIVLHTSMETSVKDSPLLNLNSELPLDILNEDSLIKDSDVDFGEFTTMATELLKKDDILVDTTVSPLKTTEFAINTTIPDTVVTNDVIKNSVILNNINQGTTLNTFTSNDESPISRNNDVHDILSTITIPNMEVINKYLSKTINEPTTKSDPKVNLSKAEEFEHEKNPEITQYEMESKKDSAEDVLIDVKKTEVQSDEMVLTTVRSQSLQRNIDVNNDNAEDDLISVTLLTNTKFDQTTENISDELKETNEFLAVKSNKDKTNVISDLINLVGDVVSIGDTPERAQESIRENAKLISGGNLYSGELLPVSNTMEHESKENENTSESSLRESALSNNALPVESQQESLEINNKKIELEEELDFNTQADTTEGNENIEHTTKGIIIDYLTDSDITDMTSMEHKDIELLSNVTLNKNTGPTKVINQENEELTSTVEPVTTSAIPDNENSDENTSTSSTPNNEETQTYDIDDIQLNNFHLSDIEKY